MLLHKFWSKSSRFLNILNKPVTRILFDKNYLPGGFSFHTTSHSLVKLFVDKENQYAHSVLEKNQKYNLFIEPEYTKEICHFDDVQLDEQQYQTPNEVFMKFKFLTKYCNDEDICISDNKFDKFVDIFTENCIEFNDEQLINSISYLKLLPKIPDIASKNYLELWNALDAVCMKRLDVWNLDKILLVCDYWYATGLAKANQFVWTALKKISRKIKKLEPHQLVHSLFLCNVVRKPVLEMFDFEIAFNNLIDKMSIEEIGVMSMGFFKTKTQINNPKLIEKLYKKLFPELDRVEDITLVNLLKILRYSSKLEDSPLMRELLERICPQIDRISLFSALHIALLGCNLQLCHSECIELVMAKFIREFSSTRLKDLERICLVMSLVNLPSSSEDSTKNILCKMIMEDLKKRIHEIMLYPKCFTSCLHYLSLCGFHNEELISTALEKNFLEHCYGSNPKLGREIFCLDAYTRIQLKDSYNGNRLPENSRRLMCRLLMHYLPERNSKYHLSLSDKILLEIKETCDELYGVSSMRHVLPHFQRPDVVICLNKKTKVGIKLNESLDNHIGQILPRELIIGNNLPNENFESIVLIVGGWNCYVKDTNRPTGIFQMKIEQTEFLQHKTVVIPWNKWSELESIAERKNFIRRQVALRIR